MKAKQELKIFKATSIEKLKALYYKSKTYLTEKNRLIVEFNQTEKELSHFSKIPILKKSLNKIENELKIFKKTNIETLKSTYYESIGII
jgi:hypothetical protein